MEILILIVAKIYLDKFDSVDAIEIDKLTNCLAPPIDIN